MNKQQLATVPNPRASFESAAPRPAWQSQPCPPWCDTTHREQDYHDDRNHFATPVDTIDLSLYDGEDYNGGSQPGQLNLAISQHYRHAEPEIDLTLPTHNPGDTRVTGETELMLTVAEAQALRDRLTAVLVLVGAEESREAGAR